MIEEETIDKSISCAVDKLQIAVYGLLREKPFYAHIIMGMRRNYTTQIKTLAVSIKEDINLWVNKEFFDKLTVKECIAVLEHEVLHLVNGHIERYYRHLEKERFNIAADMAINCYIQNLPKGEIDPNTLKREWNACYPSDFKLPDGQTTEWYYKNLTDDKMEKMFGKKPQDGRGQLTVDDHGVWGDPDKSTTGNSNYVHEKVKDLVKNALEKSGSNVGNLPAGIQRMIDDIFKPVIVWQNEMRKFLNYATEVKLKSTRKKPNRRFGYAYSGSKKEYKLSCSVLIDTSGSMDGDLLGKIWTELGNLQAQFPNIMVYEVDTEIHQKYKFKKKMKPNLRGGGGTNFVSAFKEIKDDKQDVAIVFTDGYDGGDVENPKIPTLFVEPKNGPKHYKWAKYTFIEEWEMGG